MINTTFTFDGIKSIDKGLHNVRIESGLVETPWIGGKEVVDEYNRYRKARVFHGVVNQVLEFDVTFSLLEEDMTTEKKMDLAKWLFKDDFREFKSTDNLGVVFFAIGVNQVDFVTTDTKQGYFTVRFRTNAHHGWSKVYSDEFDLSTNENSTMIEINNISNVNDIYFPELEFTLLENETEFKLINHDYGGHIFKFSNLEHNETIYIDNKNRKIISNAPYYRLGNFNKKWLGLKHGTNRIQVFTKCHLLIRCRYPLYV